MTKEPHMANPKKAPKPTPWAAIATTIGTIGFAVAAGPAIADQAVGATAFCGFTASLLVYVVLTRLDWTPAGQTILRCYGFGLSTGFLVGFLVLINGLVAGYLPPYWDLTGRRTFTLAPQTVNLLAHLDRQVEITVLASHEARTIRDRAFQRANLMLGDLLDLYQQATPHLHVQRLDPSDSAAGRQLQQRYPDVTVPCVIITYGSHTPGSHTPARHEVLHHRDLIEIQGSDSGGVAGVDFFAEQAITAALTRLSTHKPQTVIYCLTGHGELNPDQIDSQSTRGIRLLAEYLEEVDFVLKTLDLRAAQDVPTDANILLIAGPRQPFDPAEIAILDRYLKHGGSALLMFDLHYDPLKQHVAPTGLESLLTNFGILLGNDQVVTRSVSGEVTVASPALPASGEHPLVRALPPTLLTLYQSRSVRLLPISNERNMHAFPLLLSHPFPRAWADGDVSPDMLPRPGGPHDLPGPISMGAAVERTGTSGSEPILVVIGDAEFASNRALNDSTGRTAFGFLMSCLNWLRDRKELLGDIPARRQQPYVLPGDPADHRGLVWKSSLFLCALIFTAGATVWTARHRN